MRDTSFSVTIPVTVTALDRVWDLNCTISPLGWDCTPALLSDKSSAFVPGPVWDAVEDQLATSGPARIAFDAAMNAAPPAFMAEVAA
jgi:hypothetical protein